MSKISFIQPFSSAALFRNTIVHITAMPFGRIAAAVIFFIFIFSPASAAVWTVDTSDSIEVNISLASSGDTLILNPGIYKQYNITVSKDIIIKANTSAGGSAANTIIDAMDAGTAFYDNSSTGYSLTIGNLTLKNGSAANGGAICVVNGSVTITSSVITGCRASDSGGAIYSENVVDAESCSFTDCSTGIASAGGAIASSIVYVTSCAFTGCGSAFCMGGAISSDDVTAISCSFINCLALAGGGICSDAVTLRSCDFTDCASHTLLGIGGAVSSLSITAESCTFTNCTSPGDGGGIYSNVTTVVSCTFTDCSANGGGGLSSINATVTSCTFTGCYGTGGYSNGGGICSDYNIGGTFLISSSTFTGCRASAGGAVYSESSRVTVTSCTFSGCRGTDSGGAILSMDNDFLNIDSSTFTSCSALNYAGAVLSDTDSTTCATITSCTFTSCSADNMFGGVFYANSSTSTMHFCRIYDCNTGTAVAMEDGTLNAENNWWGTNSNPSLYTAAVSGGPVDVSPWLVLCTAANPQVITPGGISTVTAALTCNSDGQDTSAGGHVPDEIPVAFGLTGGPGSLSPVAGTIISGLSTTIYSSSSIGTATISTTIDGQTVSSSIQVTGNTGGSPGGGESNTDTGIGFIESLKDGQTVSFDMNRGAVYRVVLTAGTDMEKLMITVKRETSVPSSIGEPDTDVFEYEDTTLYYTDDSDLSGRTFYFKLPKNWFTSNGYTNGDIAMLVSNGEADGWEELETTYDGEKGSYYCYVSESPYISWLAIVYMESATIMPSREEESPEVVATPTAGRTFETASPSPSGTAVPASAGGETSCPSPLFLTVAVILILVIVIGISGRRRSEKYPEWWDHGRK